MALAKMVGCKEVGFCRTSDPLGALATLRLTFRAGHQPVVFGEKSLQSCSGSDSEEGSI
jgi:hypothetical protein